MTVHVPTATLDTVLETARKDSVEFPYLLANHSPMVLIALNFMGAPTGRIDEWYRHYHASHGLVPPPPPKEPIVAEAWDAALGDRVRESDYRALFTAETERLGIDGVIRFYLPPLLQGVAGSALHPLMRLAYGVMKGDKAEVGAAIGYWAACYLPLPDAGQTQPETDNPAEILAAMADVEGIRTYGPETDLLWHNIRAVGALPDFAPVTGRLKVGAETPKRMAEAALAVYAATMDFSALHAVTGLHWARIVAPHLDEPLPLYRALWQVIAALVPKIGFPALPSAESLQKMRERPAPDWDEIRKAAIASDDEHDVSLVYSASQEELVWKDPLYRVVAARRVGLIE